MTREAQRSPEARMGMIAIEKKRIPLPSYASLHGRPRRYPWDELKIGESFFVKGKTSDLINHCVQLATHRLKRRFTTRTMNGGVRVWRLS